MGLRFCLVISFTRRRPIIQRLLTRQERHLHTFVYAPVVYLEYTNRTGVNPVVI